MTAGQLPEYLAGSLPKIFLIGVPVAIVIMGIVSLSLVFNDHRRRKTRSELQRLLEKQSELTPDLAERVLALQIAEALLSKNIEALSTLPVSQYVSLYFRDIRFKRRLHELLSKRLMEEHYAFDIRIASALASSIDSWKGQAENYSTTTLEHIIGISNNEKAGKRILRFLKKRPKYFHSILDNFVIDMKDATLVAIRSFATENRGSSPQRRIRRPPAITPSPP